jgi:hypothetical protein
LKNSVMRSSLFGDGAGASDASLAAAVLVQIANDKAAAKSRAARDTAVRCNICRVRVFIFGLSRGQTTGEFDELVND